jgi:hypothetical protein
MMKVSVLAPCDVCQPWDVLDVVEKGVTAHGVGAVLTKVEHEMTDGHEQHRCRVAGGVSYGVIDAAGDEE